MHKTGIRLQLYVGSRRGCAQGNLSFPNHIKISNHLEYSDCHPNHLEYSDRHPDYIRISIALPRVLRIFECISLTHNLKIINAFLDVITNPFDHHYLSTRTDSEQLSDYLSKLPSPSQQEKKAKTTHQAQ